MKINRLVIFVLVVLVALTGCRQAELYPLCILHTNDIHGHISPERVKGWKERTGGAAVLAGCIRDIRAENQREGIPTLVLDAGDIFMGTPEGNISGGRAVTEVMNAISYDALTVGNHEFDLGVPNFEKLALSASFPFLGANIYSSSTGNLLNFLKPYIIKNYGPLKVGVIGVITEETPSIVMEGKTEHIVFRSPEETVRTYVSTLTKDGVNFFVVLSHMGLGEEKKLARDVAGIGVIVGGHSHDLLHKPIRVRPTGTVICQAGSYGRYLGRFDLQIDPRNHKAKRYSYEAIPIKERRCQLDQSVAVIVKKWRGKAGKKFNEVVGTSLSDFTSSDTAECQLGVIITDSMREATGAEIAFHNSYGIRNPLLKGRVTYRDTYKILPFDNTLYTMKLTGRQIREILEHSLGLQHGLLQVSGLRVDYNPRAELGDRVLSVSCSGAQLDDDRLYSVVTNSFLAKGGDYYQTFRESKELRNAGVLDRDALNSYIRSHSPLTAEGFRPTHLIPH